MIDYQIIFHLLLLLLSFLLLPLESLSLLRLGDRDRRGLQGLFVKLLEIFLLEAVVRLVTSGFCHQEASWVPSALPDQA